MKEKQNCRISTEADLSFSQEQMKGSSSLSGRGACTPTVVQGAWRLERVKRELLGRKGLPGVNRCGFSFFVCLFLKMVSRPNNASGCSHYYTDFLDRSYAEQRVSALV